MRAVFSRVSWRSVPARTSTTSRLKRYGTFWCRNSARWYVLFTRHLIFLNHFSLQRYQVELLTFFSGCSLRLVDVADYHPWLFGVFAWLRILSELLTPPHAGAIVNPTWLPNLPVSSHDLAAPPPYRWLTQFVACY